MGESKVEVALEVARAAWVNPANPASATTNATTGATTVPFFTANTDLGSASGFPQLEGRIMYALGNTLTLSATGHYHTVQSSGWGATSTVCSAADVRGCPNKTVYAGVLSGRLAAGPVTVAGSIYNGQNLAPLIGEMASFPSGAGYANQRDVPEWGGWGNVGFNLTKELSIWALAGHSHPNNDAAKAALLPFLRNTMASGMVRYNSGGYTLAIEYTHWHSTNRLDAATLSPVGTSVQAENVIDANQFMFSGFYFF